ncbi:rCG58746 [Rattus norvegicus]|uniref:RCG58746 n=1 Tax=Rattus norvegicus TaxID=10116 RepID=A6JLI7_RAT|nr:rCG58746 [Rattus norvegicus]
MRHSEVRMQGSQCSFSFCAFTIRTSTSTVQSSLLPPWTL